MKNIAQTVTILVTFCVLFAIVKCQTSSISSSYAGVGSTPRSNSIGSDISISAVSVLLPQDPSVSYRLDVFNGCFRWAVTNPDVIDIELKPEDQECGRSVYIRPSSRYGRASSRTQKTSLERERTWITAEDKHSQRLIRAEVFTDRIKRFEVITVNRNLRKDDIEVIGIQAYDQEGNVFSSIEGLEFQWTVQAEPNTGREASSLLQLLPLKDSHIEATDLVLRMETEGRQSGAVLAQAKSTGRVSVSARLVDPSYSDIPARSVILSILEPLNLVPSALIYMPPHSTTTYVLQTIERESFRNISMPNPEYVWKSSKPEIASVNSHGLVNTHGVLGTTSIEVRFTSVDDNNAYGHLAVVEPYSLDIQLIPLASSNITVDPNPARATTTFLIENVPYKLFLHVYDIEGNRLFSTNDIKFEVTLDAELFRVDERSENGGVLHVLPLKSSTTQIQAAIKAIGTGGKWELKRTIQHLEDITIVPPLRVIPSLQMIALPYHPHTKHSIHLGTSGGSGMTVWTSNNRHMAPVTSQGVVMSNLPGSGSIRCADANLPYNKVDIPTVVAIPHQVAFSKGPREVEAGHALIIGISLFGLHPSLSESIPFNNCSSLSFVYNLSNPEVFGHPTTVRCPPELVESKSCACVQLVAQREGISKLAVTFDAFDPSNPKFPEVLEDTFSRIRISSSVQISSFKAVNVSPSKLLLTYGATAELTIIGGPKAWSFEHPVTPQLIPSRPDQVSIEPLPSSQHSSTGLWKYKLSCLAHGEQVITVIVGNVPSPSNPDPVSFQKDIPFGCQSPHAMLIHPYNPNDKDAAPDAIIAQIGVRNGICLDDPLIKNLASGQPAQILSALQQNKNMKYMVRAGKSLPFNLTMLDEQGRIFDDFSSLSIEWSTSDSSIVSFAAETPEQRSKRDRVLQITQGQGTATVGVKVTGYDSAIFSYSTYLSSYNFPKLPLEKLTASFMMQVAQNSRLVPQHLSLYNHPENKVLIRSEEGSGYSQIRSNNSQSISVTVEPGTSNIYVQPLRAGTTELSAIDSCLVGSRPVHSIVRVSDAYNVKIKSPSILQLGEETTLNIEVLDLEGHPFTSDQLKLMDIKIHVEGESVAFKSVTGQRLEEVNTQSNPPKQRSPAASPSVRVRSKRVQGVTTHPTTLSTTNQVLSIFTGASEIKAFGAALGASSISVTVSNAATGALISSVPVQIQVFSPMAVYPKRLELLPGGSFQLEVSGGPPTRSKLVFTSSNHSLATISPDGTVSTKNLLGSCSLTVSAHVKDTSNPSNPSDLIFEETVELVVKHLSGILIHSSTTRLVVGEEIVVRVAGQENESPFIWSGIDLSFQWEAVNPDILGLSAIYSKGGISVEEEQGQAVVVKALSPGTTRLSTRIVAGPSYLGAKSASLAFEIVPSLSLVDSESSKQPLRKQQATHFVSQRLLLAPFTRHSVRSNLRSTYTLLDSNPFDSEVGIFSSDQSIQEDAIIKLDSKLEQVTSTGIAGTSIIQLKDNRDQQILLVQVSVRPIHHLELRARSPVHWDLPVGSTMDYDVVLKDNLGREFDSYEYTKFSWHMSKHDVVHLELLRSNESEYRQVLRVKGVRPGKTMLQIGIESAHSSHTSTPLSSSGTVGTTTTPTSSSSLRTQSNTANFQHFHTIRVSNAILPLAPVVHIGASIQFHTSFAPSTSKTIWSSNQEKIVSIDAMSGLAQVHSFGRATIYHNSSVYTQTNVRAVKVSSIDMDTRQCKTLSNLDSTRTDISSSCLVPLTFRDPDGHEMVDTSFVHHNINATCYSDSPSIIKGELIVLNQELNTLACSFTAVHGESDVLLERALFKVDAFDSAHSYTTTSQTYIPFIPAFVVKGRTFKLTPANPSVEMTVLSSQKLVATSRDPSRVTVMESSFDASSSAYTFQIQVLDNVYPFATLGVDFLNTETRQTETIIVSYASNFEGALVDVSDDSFFNFWTAIGIGSLTFAVAYIISVVCGADKS